MDNPQSTFLNALHSDNFATAVEKFSFIIGMNDSGEIVTKDLAALTHLVIAGATGTGKSTLAHAILLSLIAKTKPDNLKLILCDTKVVEFGIYRSIPHMLIPTISEPSKVSSAIAWTLSELNRRLTLINNAGYRSIETFNDHCTEQDASCIPHILLVIDDVANAIDSNETWNDLRQIAQNGRAGGIHLLLITQTPGDKKLADIIKSSIPARAVFNIFNFAEEKMLLGASKNTYLSDVGEIIYCVMPGKEKERIRCYPISDSEISTALSEIKKRYADYAYSDSTVIEFEEPNPSVVTNELNGDEMLPAAVDTILETGQASVSVIQRQLKIGYARSARIMDEMEEKGIVGPFMGSKPRSILITKEQWEERKSDSFSHDNLNTVPIEIESMADNHQHSVDTVLDTQNSESITTAPTFLDQSANTPDSDLTLPSSTVSFRPKPAIRKSAPVVSDSVRKIEWVVFACGCLLLLGCFLGDFESPSDRSGMFIFGLGACVLAKARSIRWVTISIIFGLAGIVSIPKIWNNGQFDLAYFITVCLCIGISIVFGRKVTWSSLLSYLRYSSATLHSIDAMSGIEFEEYTAHLLKKLGYSNVRVTQASGDQGIDVLAQKDGIRYAIQCKNYSGKLGNTPVQEAFAGKTFYGCDIAVVLTNSTFTDGAFELAESTGVQLWDRNTLADMIHHAK